MPAGPSGPAQPGVITAVLSAIAKAGKAARLAMPAKPVRRRTGRSRRDGRHSSAAQPAIRATSKMTLTRSSAPNASVWPLSGPNGNPLRREAKYTATMIALPSMPSHSHGRDGRQSTTAAQIAWAQEMMRKKTP